MWRAGKLLLMTLWLGSHFGRGYRLDRPSLPSKGEPEPSEHHAVLRLVVPKMCYLSQGKWITWIIKIHIRAQCSGLCRCWSYFCPQPLQQSFKLSNRGACAKGWGIKWGYLAHVLNRGTWMEDWTWWEGDKCSKDARAIYKLIDPCYICPLKISQENHCTTCGREGPCCRKGMYRLI